MGDQGVAVAAPIVAAVVIMGAWCLNAPGIARAQNLLDAVMTQMAVPDGKGGITGAPKDPKDNLAQFKIALGEGLWPGTSLGLQETTEQLLQFSSNQASSNVDPSVKQDTHDLAEEAGIAINTKRPHDARLELFMGVFYASFGQHAQSTQWLGKALADSPSKQQILFQVGIDAVNAGDTAKAVAVMKQAFDEEPNFESARIMYASALYYAGDTARADALLTDKFGTVLVDDSRLMQVFTTTKQYGRVVSIWQKRIAANPNDAQQYIGLAGVYFTAGDTANTIATLQKAAAVDPSLAAQVKTVIEQLQNGTLKAGQ
jgi:Tfp pilus assembly protein PilF